MSKDGREIADYIEKLGYRSVSDIMASPNRFLEALPDKLRKMVDSCASEDKETAIYTCFPHILKSWCAEEVYPHDERGQALFYQTLLPMLSASPYLGGAVIYCWSDSDDCFSCGAKDCPCETAWGLIRLDGSFKPSYHAVRSIYHETVSG